MMRRNVVNMSVGNSQDQHNQDLAWTYKIFQERCLFTDVVLVSADGSHIGAHSAILLRNCAKLSWLASRHSCCFCHGKECGQKQVVSISLPDFDKQTVHLFVELLYTGRAYFNDKSDYEGVLHLARNLGLDVPPSAMSLEELDATGSVQLRSHDGLTSFFRRAIHDAEHMDRSDFSLGDADKRKKKRRRSSFYTTASVDSPAADDPAKRARRMSAAEQPARPEGESEYRCEKCSRAYGSKRWLSRHMGQCTGGEPLPPADDDPADSASLDSLDRKECPQCRKVFALQGGWYTKHTKTCHSADETRDEPAASPNASFGTPSTKKACQLCHKEFSTQGGWYRKHVNVCAGPAGPPTERPQARRSASAEAPARDAGSADNLSASFVDEPASFDAADETASVADEGARACPKCGKEYAPHVRRFYKAHVAKCDGAKEDYSLNEEDGVDADAAANGDVENVSFYLDMYKRNEWTCYLCNKAYERRDVLRQHLLVHFKADIKAKYLPDSATKCSLCGFDARDEKFLLQHVSIAAHQKLRDFIDEQVANALFMKKPRDGDDLDNSASRPSTPSNAAVAASDPAGPAGDQNAPVSAVDHRLDCYICSKQHRRKADLRQHIFCHIRLQIQAKYYPDNAPMSACLECNYKSTMGEHVLMHLALKHDRLQEFLPGEVKRLLYNNDGSKKSFSGEIPCVRCKNTFGSKKELKAHFDSCPWKCERCQQEIKDPKSIKRHKAYCGKDGSPPKADEKRSPQKSPKVDASSNKLLCHLCNRSFSQFHYLKGHLSMHYREELKAKVGGWGGGQGGSGYSCRLCDFVSTTSDSLVNHAGYKHALFVEFMGEGDQRAVHRMAEACGEDILPARFACPNCSADFSSQCGLAGHMASVDCRTVRCLLCDAPVGSALQYRCHLLGHYRASLERDMAEAFATSSGGCDACDTGPIAFEEYVEHFALEHGRLAAHVSAEVKAHLTGAFAEEGADDAKPDSCNAKDEEEVINPFDEEIHIEIESVDDAVTNVDDNNDKENDALMNEGSSVESLGFAADIGDNKNFAGQQIEPQ